MDAIIKVTSAEFNEELFRKIGTLIKGRNAEVSIAIHDKIELGQADEDYWERLRKSIDEMEAGKVRTFSISELEEFIKQ